jgi:SAM-dependent methyltransferase
VRNSSRTYLRRENEAFAHAVAPGSLVLDAGAGDQPYRDLFKHCIYESADFEKVDKPYAKSTYVCDLSDIPVEDGHFDAVICNQLMEHVPEPKKIICELCRVLKAGGRMIFTAPLFYEEHEAPYDFYRYTQFAWRRMISEAGLELERLDWMEGYFGTVAYQLSTAGSYLPKRPKDYAPGLTGWLAATAFMFIRPAMKALALVLYRLDETTKYTASGFPKNYVAIVRKP